MKNTFWLVHRELGLQAKVHTGTAVQLPTQLGTYDITVIGAVLLHSHDPIGILLS